MRSPWFSPLLLAVGILMLAACATQTSTNNTSGIPANDLHSWALKGKIGITTAQERLNASIDWQQRQQQFQINLSGPFGQGRAELEGDDQRIRLTSGDDRYEGDSAEQLMQEQLGWSVPVRHFSYWAKGVPSPEIGITAIEYDAGGNVSLLVQDGWEVELTRYQAIGGWQLPGKMNAKTRDIALLLVVKEWQLQ